jgi:hypothetical protein
VAGKYTFNNGRLEFSNRVSEVLTEEDYKAQAAFAQASAVNPAQAATIIKNAQGNLMSPGVLASLSNLNVDAQSGVAKSIAQIDADTREARMADQKAVAQKRKQEEFDATKRGIFWRGVKGAVKGTFTIIATPFQTINATYRNVVNEVQDRGVISGVATGLNMNPFMSGEEKAKVATNITNQVVVGKIFNDSVEKIKAKQNPLINIETGKGFFVSEETGVGHAVRQASLDVAKVAVRDSKGKVIGYQPRSFFGDAVFAVSPVGSPETKWGAVIYLASDIAGSFLTDPGVAKAQRAKQLRKLAQQERVAGAMGVAAKYEQEAAVLEEALTKENVARKAAVKQADAIKNSKLDDYKQQAVDARAAWSGKAEEAIKANTSVRAAQGRLDEIAAIEAKSKQEIADATAALKELTATAKAPVTVARTESAIIKQTKILDQLQADKAEALAAGRIAMTTDDELAQLSNTIETLKTRLAEAQALAKNEIPTDDILSAAKQAVDSAKRRLAEAKEAKAYSAKQVAERSRNAKITARAREIASRDSVKKITAEKNLSRVLADATSTLDEKLNAWESAVRERTGVANSFERSGLDYQAIAEFLTGGYGTIAVDRLVDMTDWKVIWRKSGGRIDSDTARGLAAATNKEEVVDILAPYIKRGDIMEGTLRPGIVERTGARIADRTQFAAPLGKYLVGVGARVESRINEHKRTAAVFEAALSGSAKIKDFVSREYKTKVKSGSIINIHDREEMLRAAEDFGVAAKLDKAVLDNIIEEIATAPSASVAGYAASVKLLEAVFQQSAAKVPEYLQPAFRKATTAFKDSNELMSNYWATRHAAGAELKYLTLKGEQITLQGPHLGSELLNSTIYLPPTKEILSLTSKLSKSKILGKSTEYADIAINDFWKNLQLVRPAYIIRNIAEEQIRVFGTGHISFFNNPGMAVAMWLGREEGGALRRTLNKFDTYRHTVFNESFSTGDDIADVLDETLGQNMKNSYVDLMTANRTGAFDDRAIKVLQFKGVGKVPFGHKRFFDGLANSLRILNSDEVSRVVAGYNPSTVAKAIANGAKREDAVVDYFLTGAGRKSLDNFASAQSDEVAAFLRSPDGLRQYLYTGKSAKDGKDISILARVNEAAGGNRSLLEMIATGKTTVAGVVYRIPRAGDEATNSIQNAKAMRSGKKALLAKQEEFAKTLRDTFSKAGNWDGVEMNVPTRNQAYIEGATEKRSFVDMFFEKATEFEKNSTFGPEFRQAYWEAINTLAKALDADAVKALEGVAENSLKPLMFQGKNIGSKHPVWSAFKASDGTGSLTLKEAHEYADTYARNKVKGLFYNAQEKRLIFHQLRLVAPFANAWEDTIRKWSEIGLENPGQLYKGIKTLEWLQKPESSAIYQVTDARDIYDPKQGFFFNDPDSGQRLFWVPFAGTVMSKLANIATPGVSQGGAPMAFAANPMSFNFALGAGSILPGVGPGVTIPISLLGTFNQGFVDNLPEGVKNWLFPFGRVDFSSGLQSAILPANWNRVLGGAMGIEENYASNFKPVMSYLAGGGNYNLDDAEDQAKLVRDTDMFSRWQSIMRGVVGLVSPAALISKGLGKDENGDATTHMALYNDFQEILNNNDGDWNKGWYDFLNLYGPSQAFALISSSTGNGPSNWDSYQFVVDNPDVASKYTDVWGYVMPGGGLSQEMYKWNLVNNTKKKLTPKEILEKVNGQRYYAARDALMTKVDGGELDKDQYKIALQYLKDSMGGGPVVEFDPNKRGRVVAQLENLIQDERFADVPSVVALRDYMYIRQAALDSLGKKKFTGAANEQTVRDLLAQDAVWIVKDNPDFQKMFYAFFANELEGN